MESDKFSLRLNEIMKEYICIRFRKMKEKNEIQIFKYRNIEKLKTVETNFMQPHQ